MSDELDRLRDKKWRMEHLYKIIDKDGNIVNFKLNKEQNELLDLYLSHDKNSEYGRRVQLLKARQIGFTTFHCIYNLDEVVWQRGKTAAIIAHEREALEKIFRKVKFAFESMPDWCRPSVSMENKRELIFNEINSNIYIALKVRSGTVHYLHVSEIAYIQEQQELKSGSFQAVPKSGHITIETTGNGFNRFYSDWQEAKSSGLWTNVFFPWTNHDAYVAKIELLNKELNPSYEQYLNECTKEQKNWWYLKLAELGGDFNLIKQEYPLTEDDAFMSTGLGVFDDVLDIPGILEPIQPAKENYSKILDTDWDYMTIYEEFKSDGQYRIGADPSGGFSNGDPASFFIIDARTYNIVAMFHGIIPPDVFGRHIERWAIQYNNAFVGIEVNNHGLTTINEIKETYANLYQRERRDTVTNEMKRELGWLTTHKSKEELIDLGKKLLREGVIPAIPIELKTELRTFVRKENGSMEAEDGAHDDRVMAFLICAMMCAHFPYFEIGRRTASYMGRVPKYNERQFGGR